MIIPHLFVVCNARRQFIGAFCARSIDQVQNLSPEWQALHLSRASDRCWRLYRPEGHVVLEVFAFELAPDAPASPLRRDAVPRFMLGDPNKDAA